MQGPVPAGWSMHCTIALLKPAALYRLDHVKQVLNKEIINKLIIIILLQTTSPSCQLMKKTKVRCCCTLKAAAE